MHCKKGVNSDSDLKMAKCLCLDPTSKVTWTNSETSNSDLPLWDETNYIYISILIV